MRFWSSRLNKLGKSLLEKRSLLDSTVIYSSNFSRHFELNINYIRNMLMLIFFKWNHQILHIPYCTGEMLHPNFDSTACLRELSIVVLSHLTHSFNCCIIFLRMALLHFHNSGYLKCFPLFTITRTGIISMLPCLYVLLFLQGGTAPSDVMAPKDFGNTCTAL